MGRGNDLTDGINHCPVWAQDIEDSFRIVDSDHKNI